MVPLLNIVHYSFALIHNQLVDLECLYVQCVLVNVPVFSALQERERRRQHVMLMKAVEARKKAEVVYMHTNKCRNTHSPLHKKSLSHYSLDGFPLSLLFVRSFPSFIFFFFSNTLTKSKDSGPQALFF